MTNMDKLYASVGLDTEFSYLPADVVDNTKTAGENVVEFNRRIIEATKASAGCYKVQIAYYESLGLDGMGGVLISWLASVINRFCLA